MSSTMRDGETAREYADRLQRERQEAAEAQSLAWEARRREQAQHDLAIARQMAALVEQLNSFDRGHPRGDSPIQTVPAAGLFAGEIAGRIEAFIQVMALYA
jgi:hypothetical protein